MNKNVKLISMIVTFMTMEVLGDRHPQSDFYLPIINTPQRPFLKWLCDGTKTAEGRVYRSTCKKMRKGSTIVLEDKRRNEWIFGKIKFLHKYSSFRKMLETEGVENMLPFICPGDIEGGVRIYESFPGGRRAPEGCVAIGIDVQKNNFGEIIKRKPSDQTNEVKKSYLEKRKRNDILDKESEKIVDKKLDELDHKDYFTESK